MAIKTGRKKNFKNKSLNSSFSNFSSWSPVNKEKHERWVKTRVPERLHRGLKSEAAALGLKLEEYVRQILEKRRRPK